MTLVLSAVLLLGLFPAGAALENVVYTAAGNTLLPLSDATMPAWFYDAIYIPYTVFTSFFGVSSSFDASANRLTLFNLDYVITYDLNLGFSYDGRRTAYLDAAKQHNGMIYVPAQFTAEHLGLYYTYFPSGPLVRIKTLTATSDGTFMSAVSAQMDTYLEQYLRASANNPGTGPSQPGTQPVQEDPPRPIYLVFSGSPSPATLGILESLAERDVKATFVVDGQGIAEGEDIIRRIAVDSHSIAIGGNAAADPNFYTDSSLMFAELKGQNDLLRRILKTRTRIVLPTGVDELSETMQQALADEGYRLWRTTFHPGVGENDNADSFYRNTVDALEGVEGPLIVRLGCDGLTADALPQILDRLKQGNYSFYTISDTDTQPPV